MVFSHYWKRLPYFGSNAVLYAGLDDPDFSFIKYYKVSLSHPSSGGSSFVCTYKPSTRDAPNFQNSNLKPLRQLGSRTLRHRPIAD